MIGGAALWTREIKTAFHNAATSTVAKVWIFLEIQNHNNCYNQSICYSDKLKKINVFYVRCVLSRWQSKEGGRHLQVFFDRQVFKEGLFQKASKRRRKEKRFEICSSSDDSCFSTLGNNNIKANCPNFFHRIIIILKKLEGG
jgi:hypothetical protein